MTADAPAKPAAAMPWAHASDSDVPAGRGPAPSAERLDILDGWRAFSILAVICGHWLPLSWFVPGANDAATAGGMAVFFTLSGFLITRFLLARPEPGPFLLRRVLRILPLAWAAMLILWAAAWWQGRSDGSVGHLLANLAFYANLPPARLFEGGEHLWSLCVEMQFYLGIAAIVMVGGRRGLLILAVLAVAVTLARVWAVQPISIVTWHRLDEILAGATLALVYHGALGSRPQAWLRAVPFVLAAAIALAVTWFVYSPPAYLRPYGVALMIGVSLYHCPSWFHRVMTSRPAAYIAEISYALYVFHLMFAATWLGSGDTAEKYLKRPLLAGATWAAAHVSTFYYERFFTDWGRRLTARKRPPESAE